MRPPRARRAGFALLAALLTALPPPSAAGREERAAAPFVDQLVAEADDLIRRGSLFEAIARLEKAVEAAPGRSDLRLRLAALMKQRGMWLRGAEQYQAVLASEPGNVRARLGHGELLLAEYQFREAAEEFRRVLDMETGPEDRDRALAGLGSALYGRGRYREALQAFQELLSRRPDDPSALAFSSLALRKLGDLDGAIGGFTRLLALQPDLVRARVHLVEIEELRAAIVRQREAAAKAGGAAGPHARLGDLLVRKPDLDGAAAAYRAALAADPSDAEVRFKLGAALRDSGRWQEAAEAFAALSGSGDPASLAGYNLAYCARRRGDAAGEAAAWRQVVEAAPRDGYAYRRFLMALARTGGGQEELRLLLASIRERPADPLPRIQYAALARFAGREDEGAHAVLDALSLEPNDPQGQAELHAALAQREGLAAELLRDVDAAAAEGEESAVTALRKGVLLSAAGRPAEALRHFEAAAAARPSDARIAVALALCRRASGAPAGDVLEALGRARDLDPGYLYARLDLAATLQSVSRFPEAVAEAEAALEISPRHPVALTILGASLRLMGGRESLEKARLALRGAVLADPMDSTGAARFLLAKVSWELGREQEARSALRGELPAEPDEMYRLAWEAVRDTYHDRRFNGQDWNLWRDRFDGKLETEADALGAIARMLASLDNRDTRLRSADQTVGLFFTPRSTRVERDTLGRTAAGSKTVESTTLPGNLGYVAVTNMTDPKLVEEVRGAVGKLKERDGVILDLRGNPGGSERDVEEITSFFVRPGTPTGSVLMPGGPTPVSSVGAAPPILPDKPVVVLVDRNTGSSAEALAGALKESRRALVVGEHTYGKAGIQLPRLLPDGTILLVSSGENADLRGEPYTGRGVVPDVAVEGGAMPVADPDADLALKKAREILIEERARSRNVGVRPPRP